MRYKLNMICENSWLMFARLCVRPWLLLDYCYIRWPHVRGVVPCALHLLDERFDIQFDTCEINGAPNSIEQAALVAMLDAFELHE